MQCNFHQLLQAQFAAGPLESAPRGLSIFAQSCDVVLDARQWHPMVGDRRRGFRTRADILVNVCSECVFVDEAVDTKLHCTVEPGELSGT
jgi:hypothetical protein